MFNFIAFLIIMLIGTAITMSIWKKQVEATQKSITLIVGVVISFLIAVILSWGFVVISAGKVGVLHLFGRVNNNPLEAGLHVKNPLAQVTIMSVRTEEYTMSIISAEGTKSGDDSILALTKEGLNVGLDLTVLYHLDKQKAPTVYKELGINYEEKVVRPEIRSSIRNIIAEYNAKEIYSEKRSEISSNIHKQIKEKLESRGIIIENVLLRNVNLPAQLIDAIEEKLTAEQEAQKYDFILQREEKEKKRKIIEAEGQREAQKIINESLTDKYLNYLYIKELKEREGTIYVPTGQNGMPMFKNIE